MDKPSLRVQAPFDFDSVFVVYIALMLSGNLVRHRLRRTRMMQYGLELTDHFHAIVDFADVNKSDHIGIGGNQCEHFSAGVDDFGRLTLA